MFKRKSLLTLAALVALGLPCLAMSDLPSSVSTEGAEAETRQIHSEADALSSAAEETNRKDRPIIRRTPPVKATIQLLPPVKAVQQQAAQIIPASSSDEPSARQVAATLPANDIASSANLKITESTATVREIDNGSRNDAVSASSVREIHRVESPPSFTIQAATQLTANNRFQVAQQVPPVPHPTDLAPAPHGIESVPHTVTEPITDPIAESAPPTQHSPSQPYADEPAIVEQQDGDYEYGPGCGGGYGPFCRRHPPVVCYRDRPFGWYVRNAIQPQVVRGVQDQLVLYHYDFEEGPSGDQLSSRGRHQLEKFSRFVDSHGYIVVIEPTEGRPELDAARHAHVAMQLSTMAEAATEHSVVVARPRAPGLRGAEAYEIDLNLIRQTQARGRLMTGSGGGGFGFTGSVGLDSGGTDQ